MKKQFLFIPLFWILLISCNNKSELKDTNIIAKFVTDSLLNGYAIDSLDIYDMDSSFLFASNHPSYIALYDELMVDIRELISKVDYYNFEKNV
ncbi:MAG TPA: hypothetical protein PKH58_06400, partial [Paludibacteraceae bacterium]|nr:hypothetical protein [Paludibacteraceae bacterium]